MKTNPVMAFTLVKINEEVVTGARKTSDKSPVLASTKPVAPESRLKVMDLALAAIGVTMASHAKKA